jgi:NAD(P)-dependent dehydrogenase (short-subunit alcohol dehydrogenase family)
MKDIAGKVAFVTGGNSGIGLGIVKVLAANGMKVAFSYRREDHRDAALAYFKERPEETVLPVRLEVTDRAAYAAAADTIERELGPVRVLVSNAGVGILGPVEQATYQDWDWILGVNLGGVINGIQTFLPRMLASDEECHIVNVSSMGGIAAIGTATLYMTSKFAVVGLSEALRTDMIGRKIGVSVYCPGPVKSNIGDDEKGRPAHLSETGYDRPKTVSTAEPPEMMVHAMEAVDAGRYVLDGILGNKLYILSHPEFRDVIKARGDALLAAVPDEPINEARAESVRWLLSNAIYSDGA